MTSGSVSFVSIIVVLVRRHYFMKRFQYLIENNAQVRDQLNAVGAREVSRLVISRDQGRILTLSSLFNFSRSLVRPGSASPPSAQHRALVHSARRWDRYRR